MDSPICDFFGTDRNQRCSNHVFYTCRNCYSYRSYVPYLPSNLVCLYDPFCTLRDSCLWNLFSSLWEKTSFFTYSKENSTRKYRRDQSLKKWFFCQQFWLWNASNLSRMMPTYRALVYSRSPWKWKIHHSME